MADFDIKVLLAEAKDDPRFQKITTNGLRMGSTALSNDPIVSGVDGGNAPLLFNVQSNTASLFDVAIDIFIILQEEIANTVTLADVISTLQSKGLVNFVNIKDLLETKISTLRQESVETISRFTVEQEKAVADIFNTSDNVEDLLAGRNYKEIINAIDYVAKEQKLIMHRGIGGTVRYPLADIAIAMSHPVTQGGANNLQQGLKPRGDFGSGYTSVTWPLNDKKWKYWEYQYRSNGTFSSSGPYGNNYYTLNPYFIPSNASGYVPITAQGFSLVPRWSNFTNDWYDWDKYMPELKHQLENFYPSGQLGITGSYVYWWMPGYHKAFAPMNFTGGQPTWHGPSIFAASPLDYSEDKGIPLEHLNIGTIRFAQIFDTGNPNLPKTAGSTLQSGGFGFQVNLANPLRELTAENTPVLANTENAKVEDFKGQLVKTVSEIEEIKKRSFQRPKELLHVLSETLVPKGKVLPAQKINFEEVVTFAQSITLKPQAFKVDDEKHPDKIGKGLLELLLQKEHVLTPKAARLFTKFFASDNEKLKIGTNLQNQKVKLLDKHSKDIGLGKRSENIETFSHLIDSPAETIIKGERVSTSTEKQKKATKPVLNNVDLSDTEFFKMNRALFEIFDLKDFVFTPVKSKIESDRALLKSTKAKDVTKPISNNIDLSDRKTFDSIKSLFTDNGAFRVNTVNPTKARVESDKVLLKSFTDILRQFELIEKAVLDAGIIEKDIEKIIHHASKSSTQDIRLVTANSLIHGEVVGVVSRDRDAGGSGDVFFTFRPAFRTDKILIEDEEVVKDVTKPLSKDSAAIKQVLIQRARAKIIGNKALVNDVLFAFNIGKGIRVDRIVVDDEEVVKNVEKPFKTVGDLRDFFLTTPASIAIKRSTFTTNDNFNPWVMNKFIHELGLTARDLVRKKYLPRRSIDNVLQSSEKGVAFIRDEEYTKGPYFLQPYVAAIPPGRSRQF
tara:strand:+ start:596 stop:3460 length:2865 start_codon:yes stop_codon:yes gene_type:complete